MSAWGVTAGRAALARRALPAVVISLTAWLSLLGPAAQAALAVSGRPAPIAAGSVHSCVTESGKAYCWGYNLDGELGDGSTADSSVPVAVDTSGVLAGKVLTQISALGGHTCALDTAGAAYCWGFNLQGELGDGSTADSSVPVAVDTSGALAGKTVTQISAGGFHTCAVTATGTAYCWGSNQYGQLGNGAATDSGLPVAVAAGGALAGQAIAQVSVGDEQACAVTAAGVPSCRGDNLDGQLGDGSTVNSSVPAVVYTGGFLHRETVIQITAGGDHTCAVDAAGAAYCWGQNFYGELGDGTSHRSKKPVLVGPRAPARVHAAPGDTTATVSWTAPRRLDGGTLTGYTATASPGGAECVSTGATTCTITGLGNGTSYLVTVVAHSTVGDSGASRPVTVIPAGAPAFSSAPAVTAAIGAAFSFTVTTTGRPAPRITRKGRLPAGVSFANNGDGTATISGTPGQAAAGRYPLVLTARNHAGTATQAFTLTITSAAASTRS